jgi:hypothetical protein
VILRETARSTSRARRGKACASSRDEARGRRAAAQPCASIPIRRGRSSTWPPTKGRDVLVVGNAGMAAARSSCSATSRTGISHNARCTVVIVNTTDGNADRRRRLRPPQDERATSAASCSPAPRRSVGSSARTGWPSAREGTR